MSEEAAKTPAPGAASPVSEKVIFWGKVSAGLTAIATFITGIIVVVIKIGEMHALVSTIPQLTINVTQLQADVRVVKEQTARDTLTSLIRNELHASIPRQATDTVAEVPRPAQDAQRALADMQRRLAIAELALEQQEARQMGGPAACSIQPPF